MKVISTDVCEKTKRITTGVFREMKTILINVLKAIDGNIIR